MRFLSRRRRHPLAGFVVLLLGLVVAGGVYSTLAPRSAGADTADARQVETGRQLFLVGCAGCHGKNAAGILAAKGGNYGPSLVGVGAAAVDFQVGTGRMPLANSSQQAPRKPPAYTAEETAALSAYVASLAPGPAIPDTEYTDPSDEADVTNGGEFFRTNCTACHNSVGAGGALPGGRYAPPLDDVSGKYIYEAMITGPQQMPVFADSVITPEDKRDIIAYIESVSEEPRYGGLAGGGLGPVSEGLFSWIIGIGGLVVAAVWIGAHGARVKKQT